MTLKESDVTSIVRYRQEKNHDARPQAVPGSDAKTVYSLSRYYELDVVIAMSWTMHHNAALSLHRWEKEGKHSLFTLAKYAEVAKLSLCLFSL